MTDDSHDSRLKPFVVLTFLLLGGWECLIKLAGDANLITPLMESTLRLGAFAPALMAMTLLCWRGGESWAIRFSFLILSVGLISDLSLGVSGRVQAWEAVPVIGAQSAIQPVLRHICFGAWLSAAMLSTYLILRAGQLSNERLRSILEERERSEERLRQSEAESDRLRSQLVEAIECLSEGFALYDADDRLVLCNHRYKEIYRESEDLIQVGVSFEEHIREAAYRGQVTEAVGREEEWVRERVEQHRNPQDNYYQQLCNGRWLRISERKTKDGGIVGVRTDITDRKLAEEALHRRIGELTLLHQIGTICSRSESEDELLHDVTRAVAETLFPDNCGFLLLDSQRGVLVSHASCVVSDPRVDKSDLPVGVGVAGRVLATGKPKRIANVKQDPDYYEADSRSCSELCLPIKFGSRVIGVLNIESREADAFSAGDEQLMETVLDLVGNTLQRIRSTQDLFDSRERLRGLLEAVPDIIFRLDQSGTIVDAKVSNANDLLLPPEQFIGKHFRDVLDSSLCEKFDNAITQANRTHQVQLLEYELDLPNGQRQSFEARIVAAATAGAFVVARNITERQRAETERRQLETQLLHSQKLESLGVLAGGIAHDFNNLLTTMLGFTELAYDELPTSSPALAMLKEVRTAAKTAAGLTKQMLAYAGKAPIAFRSLRLDHLVREMEGLLESGVSKQARLKIDLQPATINGDAAQIQQIVLNLVTNASDALEERAGDISLATGIREVTPALLDQLPELGDDQSPATTYAYLVVEDTGCGMDDETRARMFDPFFSTKFSGRGLGLAALQGIVRAHGGSVTVASVPGRGTTVEVLFPLTTTMEPESPEPPQLDSSNRGTVLVIDDEIPVQRYCQLALESEGYRVLVADNGRVGLEILARHTDIDTVLLDITMPGIDGLEVLQRLRKVSSIPVIVMSGHSEQTLTDEVTREGANSFLQKPFLPRDLLDRIRQVHGSETIANRFANHD